MDYLGGINNFYLFGKIEIRDYYLFYVYNMCIRQVVIDFLKVKLFFVLLNDIENDLIF